MPAAMSAAVMNWPAVTAVLRQSSWPAALPGRVVITTPANCPPSASEKPKSAAVNV